jgi:predicted peptidase
MMRTLTAGRCLTSVALIAGVTGASYGVTIEDFEARTFTSSTGDTLHYRLFVPRGYDSSQSYPLVMFLHGGQQRGKVKWLPATATGAKFCAAEERQAKHPCFVIVPITSKDDNWGSAFEGGPSRSLLNAMEALDAIEGEFNIDKRREYITGLSGGGKGTWIAVLSHPGRFAAAIPLCARQSLKPEEADLEERAQLVRDLPLWLWHGAKDPKNSPGNSRLMFKALEVVGADAKYTEVPDAPHNCWDTAYANDELHEWLFTHSLPESVSIGAESRAQRRAAIRSGDLWTTEDHPSGYKARTYTHPTRGALNYRLFVPEGYDGSQKYPIVVFLHGKSRKGSDNSKQIGTPGAMLWVMPEQQKERPCFVIAPQAPGDSGWGCPAILPELMDPIRNVMSLLDDLEKEFNIDTDREYITGQSGGGGGSSTAIVSYPDRFAAAALVCPANRGEPWKAEYARRVAHMPLWFFHGAVDPIVSVDLTRAAVQLLKDAGGEPRYTEYPAEKHNCWEKAYVTPELPEWLFSQSLAKRQGG